MHNECKWIPPQDHLWYRPLHCIALQWDFNGAHRQNSMSDRLIILATFSYIACIQMHLSLSLSLNQLNKQTNKYSTYYAASQKRRGEEKKHKPRKKKNHSCICDMLIIIIIVRLTSKFSISFDKSLVVNEIISVWFWCTQLRHLTMNKQLKRAWNARTTKTTRILFFSSFNKAVFFLCLFTNISANFN